MTRNWAAESKTRYLQSCHPVGSLLSDVNGADVADRTLDLNKRSDSWGGRSVLSVCPGKPCDHLILKLPNRTRDAHRELSHPDIIKHYRER